MAFELTSASLRKLCRELKLYSSAPELNDVLYLQCKGIEKLQNLEEYTGVKTLYLESNAISEIEGLSHMIELRVLYLSKNMVKRIGNLDALVHLDRIDLSCNYIKRIENLSCLPALTALFLAHNQLTTLEDVQHLGDCPKLTTLDLGDNRIAEPEVVKFLCTLPLGLLVLAGNPVISKMRGYRKRVVASMLELKNLDNEPCFDRERRLAVAFMQGGLEAEKAMRAQITQEEADTRERNRQNFNDMVARAQEEARLNPPPPPDPMRFRVAPVGESHSDDEPPALNENAPESRTSEEPPAEPQTAALTASSPTLQAVAESAAEAAPAPVAPIAPTPPCPAASEPRFSSPQVPTPAAPHPAKLPSTPTTTLTNTATTGPTPAPPTATAAAPQPAPMLPIPELPSLNPTTAPHPPSVASALHTELLARAATRQASAPSTNPSRFQDELLARSAPTPANASSRNPSTPSDADPNTPPPRPLRRPILWGTSQYQDLWQKARSMPDTPDDTPAADPHADIPPAAADQRGVPPIEPSSTDDAQPPPTEDATHAWAAHEASRSAAPEALVESFGRRLAVAVPTAGSAGAVHTPSSNPVAETDVVLQLEGQADTDAFVVNEDVVRTPSDLVSLADSAMNREERMMDAELLSIADSAMTFADTPHAYEAARRGAQPPLSERLELDSAYDDDSSVHSSDASDDPRVDLFERYSVTGYGRSNGNGPSPSGAEEAAAATAAAVVAATVQRPTAASPDEHELAGREDSAQNLFHRRRVRSPPIRNDSAFEGRERQLVEDAGVSPLLEQARSIAGPQVQEEAAVPDEILGRSAPDPYHILAGKVQDMTSLARARAVVLGRAGDDVSNRGDSGPAASYATAAAAAGPSSLPSRITRQQLYDLD